MRLSFQDRTCACVLVCHGLSGTMWFVLLGGLGVLDALDLEERGVGVGVALASLVGQVLALDVDCGHFVSVFRLATCSRHSGRGSRTYGAGQRKTCWRCSTGSAGQERIGSGRYCDVGAAAIEVTKFGLGSSVCELT